ncbi:endolytic transglycosylase MltG [Pseudahrensia aquimaris]|uniref:Endolytic murein transglycosylase n=1 Tax=Pseudahrensia aquimaris TaxID=744461 RepID=A0ABW3FEK2_9HYPH
MSDDTPTPFGRDPFRDMDPMSDPGATLKKAKPPRSSAARSFIVRLLNGLFTLAILGVVGLLTFAWYSQQQFTAPGPLQEETTYEVQSGATFRSIMPDLVAKKIIPKQGPLRIFLNGVRRAGKASDLKAGEFAFTPNMSMQQVVLQLTEGKAIQYGITLPEGLTSYQMMERIQFAERLEGPLPAIPPEGSMAPNTYAFPRGTTRAEAVGRIREAQTKILQEAWENRAPDLPLKSPEELLILASIVEKETGVGDERPHVASVFINRLRKGMRLQTDPTVIYGIWGGQGKPKDRGGLRRSELRKETPYNTYVIRGLPPTPIANPGLAAIKAAANPLETDDLYFVADGTGGHAFAKTLAEHNANVAVWRKIEAQRKKEAEEAAAKAAAEAEAAGESTDASGASGEEATSN